MVMVRYVYIFFLQLQLICYWNFTYLFYFIRTDSNDGDEDVARPFIILLEL